MTKEEWLKLPPKTFIDSQVQLSDEQRKAYYGLMKNYRVEVQGAEVEVNNALTMLSKLYQISNGFLYSNEETEEEIEADLLAETETKKKSIKRIITFFPEQPKIEALRTLLTTKLPGRKAIIWFNMRPEFELISKLLTELGHNFLSIQGGVKNIGDIVRKFNRTPDISWLVCQAKSVNYGITVLGSKRKDLEDSGIEILPSIDTQVYTQVLYSVNFSLECYLQQIDRTHRLGQTRDCEYYRIFANCPVERKLRDALDTKLNIKQSMLVDVANTLLAEEVLE